MSGGLDEHDVAALLAAGAPIDGFGIGTRLDISADAPSLDLVYKLVRFGGRDVLKLSPGKETWVGAKQVIRDGSAPTGGWAGDTLALAEEPMARGRGRAARAGDARRGAAAPAPDARGDPSTLRGAARRAAGRGAAADGAGAYPVTPSERFGSDSGRRSEASGQR